MQEIKNWLNNPSRTYAEGVALYQQFGTDRQLKNLLASEAESLFKREKLKNSLRELWNSHCGRGATGISPSAKPNKAILQAETITAHKYWPQQQDEYLKALREQWRPLYSEMVSLEHEIYGVALLAEKTGDREADQRACLMAHRILQLDEMCDIIYGKRDYYLKNNKPVDQVEISVTGDPVKWAVELKNVEKYLRTYRSAVKKNPEDEKAAAHLKKWEKRLAELRELLKMDV